MEPEVTEKWWLKWQEIVDHDTKLEECVHVNAGAIVKAGATVEAYVKLEAGEVVLGYWS